MRDQRLLTEKFETVSEAFPSTLAEFYEQKLKSVKGKAVAF